MGEKTKLRKILENLIEKEKKDQKSPPTVFKNVKTLQLKNPGKKQEQLIKKQEQPVKKQKVETVLEKKEHKNQLSDTKTPLLSNGQTKESSTLYAKIKNPSKNQVKKEKIKKNAPRLKEALKKININRNTEMKTSQQTLNEATLKAVESKKAQMASKSGVQLNPSPLQMHLIRSESLHIAQEKIKDLEENLQELRQKNEALLSASRVLKEKNEAITSQLKNSKNQLDQQKNDFTEEKKILLSTIEDSKKEIKRFKDKIQDLENRLSDDLYGIRDRENSLEGRIEILKMENSVLQKEKDKKIIQLKKQIQKTENNLNRVYKKNKDLQVINQKFQDSSHRAVSALRATIYNLEGVREQTESTINTKQNEK